MRMGMGATIAGSAGSAIHHRTLTSDNQGDYALKMDKPSYLEQTTGNCGLLTSDGDEACFIISWRPTVPLPGANFVSLLSIGPENDASEEWKRLDMGVIGITSSRRMGIRTDHYNSSYDSSYFSNMIQSGVWDTDKWYYLIYDFKREDIGNGTDKLWVRTYARTVTSRGTIDIFGDCTNLTHKPSGDGGSDTQIKCDLGSDDASQRIQIGRAMYDYGSEPASAMWGYGMIDEVFVFNDRFTESEYEDLATEKILSTDMTNALVQKWGFNAPAMSNIVSGMASGGDALEKNGTGFTWETMGYREFTLDA